MSFADQSLITNPNNNYFSFQARKYNEGKVPNPSEIISGSSHIVVIDSRERDRNFFPNPSRYSLRFPDQFKNVTSVELKGTILPKTEYNVNTENNVIIYNVEDFITSIQIKDPGDGYVDGVYGFGAVPPNDTMVSITPPAITGGVNATITVTVVGGQITSIVLVNPGSGYLRGFYGGSIDYPDEGFYRNSGADFVNTIPFQQGANPKRRASVEINVGHELIAKLNVGQYDFAHPNDSEPGLCREITRALQESIDSAIADGIITPVVGGPQTGAQYFPYSVADSSDGSCFLFTPNPNASENTNVSIQRGSDDGTFDQSLFLELLWGKSSYQDSNSMTLLGYGSTHIKTLPDTPLDQTSGELGDLVNPWSSAPIESRNDYCLTDFPKYCILCFGGSESDSVDRIESTNKTLDKAFATLVFDANSPDVVFRAPSTTAPVAGEGTSDYSSLLFKPGTLKGIKGADFDAKILSFGPAPLAELKGISIRFKKFNGEPYDFHGKDHVLLFQINCNDINSGNRY